MSSIALCRLSLMNVFTIFLKMLSSISFITPPTRKYDGWNREPRHVLNNVINRLALVEAEQKRRERPQVQRRRPDAQQVILNPPQLPQDRPQNRASRR